MGMALTHFTHDSIEPKVTWVKYLKEIWRRKIFPSGTTINKINHASFEVRLAEPFVTEKKK